MFSPLHVHSGDIESDSFQPQHHEQALGEGTVADVLTIAPRLGNTNRQNLTNRYTDIFFSALYHIKIKLRSTTKIKCARMLAIILITEFSYSLIGTDIKYQSGSNLELLY